MAFDELVAQFAHNLARQVADEFEAVIGAELESRTGSIVGKQAGAMLRGKLGPKSKLAVVKAPNGGKRLKRNMDCRVCGKRSGGPGNRYLCEEHAALPKKEQDAAIEKWKESHKA